MSLSSSTRPNMAHFPALTLDNLIDRHRFAGHIEINHINSMSTKRLDSMKYIFFFGGILAGLSAGRVIASDFLLEDMAPVNIEFGAPKEVVVTDASLHDTVKAAEAAFSKGKFTLNAVAHGHNGR